MLASRRALVDWSLQIVSSSDRPFLTSHQAHQENLRGSKSQPCRENFQMKAGVIQIILQLGTQSAPLRCRLCSLLGLTTALALGE